jgi:hypothetical protein
MPGDFSISTAAGFPGSPAFLVAMLREMESNGEIHLVKMAVGVRDLSHLAEIQAGRLRAAMEAGVEPVLRHLTRNRPRRADELVSGGSLYWVIGGFIRVRQPIQGVGSGINAKGRSCCALELDPDLVRTELRAFRPFQGWRYLRLEDAPRDAKGISEGNADMPDEMAKELRQLGLL